jgi:ferredoxin-NADP reductase
MPDDLKDVFVYRAGQYVNLRLQLNGQMELRPYSMSSAPEVDGDLQVTVKRVSDGLVSNWPHDNLRVGDGIEVSTAIGFFVLPLGDDFYVCGPTGFRCERAPGVAKSSS